MSLTNPNKIVTEERLSEFYGQILPYLGGMPDIMANKFSKADLYSTDEKIIGQWINGKPLYQKTIDCGTGPKNTYKQVAHNISDIEFIADVKGTAVRLSDAYSYPIPLPSHYNLNYCLQIAVDNTNITLDTGNGGDFSSQQCYITLTYTKSTDSAVAIGIDTDYSTSEKIIGTWIDGKPLYQICYETTFNNGQILTLPSTVIPKKFDAYLYYNDTSAQVNPFYYDANNQWTIWIDNSVIMGHTGYSAYNGRNIIITLQYTKTTD